MRVIPIPPPFPDPRKWDEVRRQQQKYGPKTWISSDGRFSLPFPLQFIRHQTTTDKFCNHSDISSNRSLYCNDRMEIENSGIYNNCETVGRSGDKRNDCQYHIDPFQQAENNATVRIGESHNNNYHDIETYGIAQETAQEHSTDIRQSIPEISEEEGEEVDVLQVDDFWIKRLSQTVKRMKKKNKKPSKR